MADQGSEAISANVAIQEGRTHADRLFGSETKQTLADTEESISTKSEETYTGSGYISADFVIDFETEIEALSSDYATAYRVSNTLMKNADLYALLHDRKFPIRQAAIQAMQQTENQHMLRIYDAGKVMHRPLGYEVFAVVLDRPNFPTLREVVSRSGEPVDYKVVTRRFLEQLITAIQVFSYEEVLHGHINPDNIYYDDKAKRLVLGECFSTFCGFNQPAGFETINRLMCHPAGKGNKDITADFFAIGMVLLYLLSGFDMFEEADDNETLNWRLKNGSSDVVIKRHMSKHSIDLPRRVEALLLGLLTDSDVDRWGMSELRAWINMEDVIVPASKIHKEATNSYIFDEQEYYSSKHLAWDLYSKWQSARRKLRMTDLGRWINLGIKRPEATDFLEMVVPDPNAETLLSDSKIARIIMIIDPSGPVRFQSLSCNINGIPSMLAYIYIHSERELLQHFAYLFSDSLVPYWIALQLDPEDYSFTDLGWSQIRIRNNLRKSELGFGIERCMYDLNPKLACQSKLLEGYFCTSLEEVLEGLNKYSGDREDKDPMDRQLAAFLGSRLGLIEAMAIKKLKAYPAIARDPQVLTLGLLSVAQSEARIKTLANLAEWINERLKKEFITKLHSQAVRKDIEKDLDKEAQTGVLKAMYLALTSPQYIRNDFHGFRQAKREYASLVQKIGRLRKKSTLQHIAYLGGLRLSMKLGYSVLALTVFYVLFTV